MLQIGIKLPQEWQIEQIDAIVAYETMTRVAQEAEKLGFTSVWLSDHLFSDAAPHPEERLYFECWTTTAALARDTSRIHIGQLVTCNSFRPPALLAKMASTVDVLSHGRLVCGIGAGWYEREYHAYGYPHPDPPTRLRQLRETLQILQAMWRQQEATFEGNYYQIRGAINQPKGVQRPHIPLLVGGKGEQVTLKLIARYADACNFTHPSSEELAHKFALLKAYCNAIGREYHQIQRTIYVNGFLAPTDAEAEEQVSRAHSKFSVEHVRTRGLLGSPQTVRGRLEELEQMGVQEVIVFLRDAHDLESLHLLAQAAHLEKGVHHLPSTQR
ncbi:LLM class F420-dependent oxidoreductase [Reticulibacter mediterranei]|uniref:LLM class F420-dependent oxidoreductase n=1 Tax=Reticulibacter mediterranei TaxID=2778369 RepID=A0A8J3IUC4_9CHLR|nr:LLM class F420-dependent oxidoreductase [Reticulibacter mediterranei]GHO98713.1 LLM class F420-dependent oxidoreductase [Reticulibacter mediterranei]